MRRLVSAALIGLAAVAASTSLSLAQDSLKLAIGQRGNWDTAMPEIGTRAGIFKKNNLVLEMLYTAGGGETQQAVISGSADIGLAAGTIGVMGAFAKGAPVRIISAEATGVADYWFVPASSPIKSIKEADGKTIAYSTNGSSTHSIVLGFIRQFGLKNAKPVSTGSVAATWTQGLTGQVDVAFSSPPFGLEAFSKGEIRIVGRGNDVDAIRNTTIRVNITNADALGKKKDAISRFVKAYKETVDYMYSSDEALAQYADFAGVSVELARRMRDEFFPKDIVLPGRFEGLSILQEEAISNKFLTVPLTEKQVSDLLQIPDTAK
jgi:NitT/TauT family transport system substrate-binding protein